ncbi:uncharacterized protein LOC127842533 [Dreissena polymorpha]|uniref:NACHT domain-containing protein n=1 Tax=Dreissena polymorpha TaxID=45954 RepID=A0A9D4EJN2_DREPO|nr:uncharacterized protein LOC127842533 [Dreissena polymorpha]KAH3780901.1 hypothetical protein DPMN_158726 [Dreissena polymorpha]
MGCVGSTASDTEKGVRELSICTAIGMQTIESAVMDANDTIASGTEAGVRELSISTARGKQDIESAVMDGNDTIASGSEAGARELKICTARGKQEIESTVIDAKREFEDFKSKKDDEDYNSKCKGMWQVLMNNYNIRLSHVTSSPLNDWVQAKIHNIYMSPNLQLMAKNKASFKKTGTQIKDYKKVFSGDNKLNKHIFIQGEAGSGKTTFLAKLVMDWCSVNTTHSFEPLQTDETNTIESDARMRCTYLFEDLTILKVYKFVFLITLRESVKQIDIFEMTKQQIIDSLYGTEGRDNAYKLLTKIMERERCLVLLDGLDEWTGNGGHYLPTLAASHRQCDVLITTRPWKLTELKIPDSKIDKLLQLEGVNEPFDVSKRYIACVFDCKENTDLDIIHLNLNRTY